MPEFVNPFSGMVPGRKMTLNELIRALRLNLAAEEEAVHAYQAHADATDNELAKAVLLDIADEERVHAGEFQRLITLLVEDEAELLAEGAAEVDAEAAKLSDKSAAEGGEPSKPNDDAATIGSLRE
jgi:rubrerythrin